MTDLHDDTIADRLDRMERALNRILTCVDRDELLTEREAAELRRKTVSALRKERGRHAGPPFIKDGGAIRYQRSQLLAWLQANSRLGEASRKESAAM
jgi:hypothetical protein